MYVMLGRLAVVTLSTSTPHLANTHFNTYHARTLHLFRHSLPTPTITHTPRHRKIWSSLLVGGIPRNGRVNEGERFIITKCTQCAFSPAQCDIASSGSAEGRSPTFVNFRTLLGGAGSSNLTFFRWFKSDFSGPPASYLHTIRQTLFVFLA